MRKIFLLFLLISAHTYGFYDISLTQNEGMVFSNKTAAVKINQDQTINNLTNDLSNFQQRAFQYFYPWLETLRTMHLAQGAKKKAALWQDVESLFLAYSEEQPLFLLSECGTQDRSKPCEKLCPLQRLENFKEGARATFLTSLLETFEGDRPSEVGAAVFYGSGGALFEMQILASLALKGTAFPNIILIDPDYSFSGENAVDMNKPLAQRKAMGVDSLRRLYRHIQLCNFVWSLNPEAKIFVYRNSSAYLADITVQQAPTGNMLVSMDPISGEYRQNGAFLNAPVIIAELNGLKQSLNAKGIVAIYYRLSGYSPECHLVLEIKGTCPTCGEAFAKSRCTLCKSTYYCDRDHQTTDWPRHKKFCRK